MSAPKKPSPRTLRRAIDRTAAKLGRDRARLADLSPGGAADRPLEVASASVIEPTAMSTKCPICDGVLQLDEHAAETVAGVRLRVARMTCRQCGAHRAIWFRIVQTSLN